MAEEAEPDVASWVEIQVTSMFTAATMAAFIIVFEFSRRNPAVAAVFDRRRSTKPHRTPPPLIRSRYFEWLFLSTDPAYSEYAEMAHTREVIRERKRQQESVSMFRLPNIMDLKRSTKTGEGVAPIVEEEEPKKRRKKYGSDHQPHLLTSSKQASQSSLKTSEHGHHPSTSSGLTVNISNKSMNGSQRTERHTRFNPTVTKGVERKASDTDGSMISPTYLSSSSDDESSSSFEDLNFLNSPDSTELPPRPPRSSTRRPRPPKLDLDKRSIKRKVDMGKKAIESLSTISTAGNKSAPKGCRNLGTSVPQPGHNGVECVAEIMYQADSRRSSTSGVSGVSAQSHQRTKARKQRKTLTAAARLLTPDVVEINGRRLPAAIAEYAIAGDLTEEQLDEYEQKLIQKEKEEERAFRRELKDRQNKGGRKTRGTGKNSSRSDVADVVATDDDDDDEDSLDLPALSRWGYFGVGHGQGTMSRFWPFSRSRSDLEGDISGDAIANPHSERSAYSKGTSASGGRVISSTGHYMNRHLKAAAVTNKRPLSISDQELLRCIGLDAYVMIRFLRFGFDTTFYPFLFIFAILIPTYFTNPYEGQLATDDTDEVITYGYFRFTINRLEQGSPRIWVAWGVTFLFFCYTLRRIWIEWETFIALRFDFLANGDVETEQLDQHGNGADRFGKTTAVLAQKDDVQLHLEQYRNSCMVEYIPDSHRRDKELFEFFDAVFPNQVKRAEILLNATTLTKLIEERQRYIEKYENLYAKQFHAKQAYRKKMESRHEVDAGFLQYLCCRCLGVAPKKPQEPKIKIDGFLCCGKKMVKALPYYLSEIKRLNRLIEDEHRRILEEKQHVEDKEDTHGFVTASLGQGLKFVTGKGGELKCNTGFVEFKNLTTKQSALQCNITGTTDYMVTKPAPDPRDIIWENAVVERATIKIKRLQMDALLFTGTLFWSAVVTFVTSISNLDKLGDILPDWLIPDVGTFWHGLVQGYLPVVILEVLMLLIPVVLRFVGENYVRFKSKSELDKFVFIWHFAYRIANLLIIIVSGSLYETLDALRTSPQTFVNQLASGIAQQSQFFLNNMIVAAGTENMWELAQMPNMFLHFVIHKVITVEAKSKRSLEKLEEAERIEWGEVVPPFIFAFLVGVVYCTMVPIVLGVCAIFFYIATKVFTHQSLFVYAQPYEGGGKLMYLLNRSVFVIIYIAIAIFSTVMGLKGQSFQGPSFFFVTIIITVLVDRRIVTTFVEPSLTLALTNARIIDEDTKRTEERARRYQEYKAAKMEERRQAKKSARAAGRDKKGTTSQTSLGGDSAESATSTKTAKVTGEVSESELPGGAPQSKTIQFKVVREESADELKQRYAAKTAAAKKRAGAGQFGISFTGRNDDGNSDEDDDKYDFYLYRQPALNKSLWETKPRPYR